MLSFPESQIDRKAKIGKKGLKRAGGPLRSEADMGGPGTAKPSKAREIIFFATTKKLVS
jgi:hypothetical protein